MGAHCSTFWPKGPRDFDIGASVEDSIPRPGHAGFIAARSRFRCAAQRSGLPKALRGKATVIHPIRAAIPISQYFIGRLPISLLDEFPTQGNPSANVVGLNDLLARVQCR